MDKIEAIAKLKAIFELDRVTEFGPEDVVCNEGMLCRTGVFYTRPDPHGDLLWAGHLREPDEVSTDVLLLDLNQLIDITYGYMDEEELQIFFELGGEGVITHQIRWSGSGRDVEACRPPYSYVDITALATHRRYLGGYAYSLMETLVHGYHTPNVQMAIEEEFEHHLFGRSTYPDIQALEALEKCLRADVERGVQRSAVQYALLYLHGSEDARCVFDRDVALRQALVLDGVPGLMRDCIVYFCPCRDIRPGASKLLLDIDGLAISGEMHEDYPVTSFDPWLRRRDC